MVSAIPQKTGSSAAILTLGAKNRSIGATKSFNSAVNDADALVFTTSLLNGDPQTSPPNKVTGSSPSLVRLTENPMYCSHYLNLYKMPRQFLVKYLHNQIVRLQ